MKTYHRLPFRLKCVGFNSSSLLLLKKGDDIHINKQTAWLDTSTVSSCGGMDLDDAPSVCCLSPTVPDFSCSARMPWHLPDTIVPSCLEGWRQCGMIWKEFGCWRYTRRKMQWAGTQLFHIYSGVCQKKKKKNRFPTLFCANFGSRLTKRMEYCVTSRVCFSQFMLGNNRKVKTPDTPVKNKAQSCDW